jgi:hypothetical protein
MKVKTLRKGSIVSYLPEYPFGYKPLDITKIIAFEEKGKIAIIEHEEGWTRKAYEGKENLIDGIKYIFALVKHLKKV